MPDWLFDEERSRRRILPAERPPPTIHWGWIEKTAARIAPRRALRRFQARVAVETLRRSYEGSAVGRRGEGWKTTSTSANAEIGVSLPRLRNRVRALVRDNPYAASAVSTLQTSLVGAGIRPRSNTRIKARDQAIDAAWEISRYELDADGQLDFEGLESLVGRTIVESGEILIRYRVRRPIDGLLVPLQVQLLEPDHLDSSRTREETNGNRTIQGIEFDKKGDRVAYWLFPEHPGETGLSLSNRYHSKRISARWIDHVYRKDRPAQARGVPWLASVIWRLRDLDEYQDAELWRKKVAACFAAFVTRPGGAEAGPAGVARRETDDERIDQIEPAMISYLRQGEGVEFASPHDSGGYPPYVATELRAIAAGIGVTYEQLSHDLSGVNFSSIRAGLTEFRRLITGSQNQLIVSGFGRKVRARWAYAATLVGVFEAGPISDIWTPDPFLYVNPLQEAMADLVLVRSGAMTIPQLIAKHGHAPDAQIEEISEIAKLLDKLMLVLDSDPRKVSKAGVGQADPAELVGPQGDEDGRPPTAGPNGGVG